MRPVRLTMQGFTCFRERVEIPFDGVEVFVICGPTGAGKSTIIDALCYALYGKIPRGTDIGDLISHDCDRMAVELEFEVPIFGRGPGERDRFRVHRGFNIQWVRGKRIRSVSPVQLEHFDGDGWEGIQDRVEEIDEEIERIVGLDFRGFTRCVVLPQGRFQEFLAGDRKDRRDILVELLDTGIYQRMMQAANTAAGLLRAEADQIDLRLRQEYAGATEDHLEQIRQDLAAQRMALEAARAVREAAQEADGIARQAGDALRRAGEREVQRARRQREIETAEQLLKDGEVEVEALRQALDQKEKAAAAVSYDRAVHEALLRAEPVARNAADLGRRAGEARTQAADTGRLEAATTAFTAAEAAQAQAEAVAARAEEAHSLAQQHYAADFLRGKLSTGDSCPVCGNAVGVLPATHRPDVAAAKKQVDETRVAARRAAEACQTAHGNVERERARHEQAVSQAESLARDLANALAELSGLVPQGVPAEHVPIVAALRRQQAARQERETLEEAAVRLRRAVEEKVQGMRTAADGLTALRAAVTALDAEITAARQEAADALGRLSGLAEHWEWSDILEALAAGGEAAPVAGRRLRAAQEGVEGAARAVERLEREVDRIGQAIVRAAELTAEMEAKRRAEGLYRTLGTMLMANRFQDFVLEEAMQALVESASDHLEVLYPRYALQVTKGDFAVIDHWQGDQVRPARTLSGGETFITSLALALALAERLPELQRSASRALESLFLDEGFGMLDPETLETVINALEGLRSRERMVGIITHVPDLAERIPVRVEVSKSPTGSTLTLVGM